MAETGVGSRSPAPAAYGRREGERRERERLSGRLVNRPKFKLSLSTSNFLPFLGLKRKTFEYHSCSVFRGLYLLFQALFHLSDGL